MYEVLDTARNFGVPYDPLRRYSTFERYQDREREQSRLKAEIDDMTGQVQERWHRVEQTFATAGSSLGGEDRDDVRDRVSRARFELATLAGLSGQFDAQGPGRRTRILRDMLRRNNQLRRDVNEIRGLLE